eukprot:COSAG05_NODE_3355_length_2128_cov_1.203056_1_plen_135_part_10
MHVVRLSILLRIPYIYIRTAARGGDAGGGGSSSSSGGGGGGGGGGGVSRGWYNLYGSVGSDGINNFGSQGEPRTPQPSELLAYRAYFRPISYIIATIIIIIIVIIIISSRRSSSIVIRVVVIIVDIISIRVITRS